MKTIAFAFAMLFLCLQNTAFAQKSQQDSLMDIMDELHKQQKFKKLLPIAEAAYSDTITSQKTKDSFFSYLLWARVYAGQAEVAETTIKTYLPASEKRYADNPTANNAKHLADFYLPSAIYYSSAFPGNKPQQAIDYLEKALDLCRKYEKGLRNSYSGIMNAYFLIMQDITSDRLVLEPILKECFVIREKLYGKKHLEYGRILSNSVSFYTGLGDYSLAERDALEAISIYEATIGKNNTDYASAIFNLAMVYSSSGLYENADKLYCEALSIRKEVSGEKSLRYAAYLNNHAINLKYLERYKEAEEVYKKCLEIRKELLGEKHSLYASSLMNIANLYKSTQRYEEATQLYREVMSIKENQGQGQSESYAGLLCNYASLKRELNELDSSITYFEKGFAIFDETGYSDESNHMSWKHRYANTLYLMGKHDLGYVQIHFCYEAVKRKLCTNFQTFSEKEKAKYYEKVVAPIFNDYYQHLLYKSKQQNAEGNELAQLYEAVLFSKAIMLDNSVRMRKVVADSKDENILKTYRHWTSTKQLLAEYHQRGKAAQNPQELDSLVYKSNQLEKALYNMANIDPNDSATKWEVIQKELKKNEVAIEFIRLDGLLERAKLDITDKGQVMYVALVINKTCQQPLLVILENGTELEYDFKNYYQNTSYFEIKDTISYAQFWKPFEKVLWGVKRIYFSADGVYHQISLNSLYNPETKKFLGETVAINQMTSTRNLLKKRSESPLKNAFLLGRPKYTLHDSLKSPQNIRWWHKASDLPGTEQEVLGIAQLLKKDKIITKTYLHEQASETALKNIEEVNILHLATHGLYLDKSPTNEEAMFNSCLLLGPNEKDDGLLSAYEVSCLNLKNTELVVLSACETARGKLENGEGVYGLQRAFKVAGAGATLLCLWPVDDAVTQKFINQFYKIWLAKKDKNLALNAAQAYIRKTHPEPYYWGPFVLVE